MATTPSKEEIPTKTIEAKRQEAVRQRGSAAGGVFEGVEVRLIDGTAGVIPPVIVADKEPGLNGLDTPKKPNG